MKHTSTVDTFLAKHTVSSHTLEAFSLATDFVDRFYRDRPPLNGIKAVILDSGCGTGRSTTTIAAQNPTLPVIGIDRSIVRLSRNKDFREANDCEVGNRLLLRADLVDFFVLALDHTEWTIHSHYILYPNPYPKSKHLKRRFHGHPVLPVIMALGGYLTLRSNWFVYPKEMELALRAVTASRLTHTKFSNSDITMIPHFANSPITNFEAKYSKFRLPLYELRADLGHRMHSERIEYLRFLTQQPRS
jgi:tRNA G46 methylase TrmB